MSNLKRRDNDVELAVRRILHAAGCRYRVHYPVPGLPRRTIDIAFTRARVAVFIDGCFWHGCPEHGTRPSSNAAWWVVKLAANADRDQSTTVHLQRAGWLVVRLWEHESARASAEAVIAALGARGRNRIGASQPDRRGRGGTPAIPRVVSTLHG